MKKYKKTKYKGKVSKFKKYTENKKHGNKSKDFLFIPKNKIEMFINGIYIV